MTFEKAKQNLQFAFCDGPSKETTMSDDQSETGNPDRQLISLSEDYEIGDLSQTFGVSNDRRRPAVDKVGNQANDELRGA